MNIPYNNGKVQIGKYYVPPKYIETDPDMLLIQSYLIGDPATMFKRKLIDRFFVGLGLFVLTLVLLKS